LQLEGAALLNLTTKGGGLNMPILAILLVGLIALIIRSSFYVVNVTGVSMVPTFTHGDRILVLRWFPSRWMRYGQIVVTRLPASDLLREVVGDEQYRIMCTRETLQIKRVVGLSGDSLVTKLSDLPPEIHPMLKHYHDADGRRVWLLSPGSVFVQGDAPGLDSAVYGSVPADHIVGLVLFKFKHQCAEVQV
jgi:signal peptidase I